MMSAGKCPQCGVPLGRNGKCPALCTPVPLPQPRYSGPAIVGHSHVGRLAAPVDQVRP